MFGADRENAGGMITVNSRKYDGGIRRSWQCEIVDTDGSLLRLIGKFADDVHHPDLGHIRKGTVSYEHYWLDRWYSIFRFHEPGGELRNYYCNINMPPTLEADVLDYIDLDIDVLVRSDFSYIILDRDEFERSAGFFDYPAELRAKVENTLEDLIQLIETRQLPGVPEIVCNI